ncbi:MAG: DNA ligase [Verrucomicrobia bacterium]|nr:DNA ligase [Verrucomicrobiota bacterium]MBU6447112.1 DNA ligase [Verrucomicrobiota bacterium]MDE3047777.1 DNA ligase [Verrucomicrobiota bacterium]
MTLATYKRKRNLKKSKEPAAVVRKKRAEALCFVVQKHAATRLHYDFRLEMNGVLKSWAIPKGPSMNPKEKRLAVQVEDHPYDYKDFEGVIPEGYGAGAVIIWDQGTYTLEEKNPRSWHITLKGKKLKGGFALVRFRDKNWLLIKTKDRYATTKDVTKKDRSVVSKRKLETLMKRPI